MTSRLKHLSIRTQLLLLIAAFAIPVIAGAVWFVIQEIQHERRIAFDKVSDINEITSHRIGQILADHEVLLRLVAAEFSGSPPIKSPRFDAGQFLRIHPQIINIGVRDLAANNIYSHLRDPKPPEEALKFPWLQRGIVSDRFEVGDAFPGNLSGRWVTVMTYPISDKTGRRTGFAYLSVDLHTFSDRVKRGLPDGYLMAVFDSRFHFLMRSEDTVQ
jgi:hypothetical protein